MNKSSFHYNNNNMQSSPSISSPRFLMAFAIIPVIRIMSTFCLIWGSFPEFTEATIAIFVELKNLEYVDMPELINLLVYLSKWTAMITWNTVIICGLSNLYFGTRLMILNSWTEASEPHMVRYIVVSFTGFGLLGLQAAFYQSPNTAPGLMLTTSVGLILEFFGYVYLSEVIGECFEKPVTVDNDTSSEDINAIMCMDDEIMDKELKPI